MHRHDAIAAIRRHAYRGEDRLALRIYTEQRCIDFRTFRAAVDAGRRLREQDQHPR